MSDRIIMEQNAKSFSTAPKFSGYDMIVLNLDENNYVSSPYAKISDETKWTNQSNGKYTFTYDTSASKWVRGSSSYTTAEMLSTWGIEIYFCSVSGLTDHAKAGDTVTVVKIKDNDPDANEKQVLQLTCEISRSGTRMEADCPLVKPAARQSVADTLLAQMYGYEYQPYSAQGAVVNPAVELGDAITAYGVYSGIYTQDLTFNSLMSSDISAPCDEEVDEEMEYESQQERAYTRKFADIAAEFLIKADEIAARVTREGTGEGFSWSLVETGFTIRDTGRNRDVFKVDSTGAHVTGEITAETGYIGTASRGFHITASSIYNGVNAADSTQDISMSNIADSNNNGIYIGTDGIYLGGGKFQATSSGAVSASNLTITGGSIKLGGTSESPVFQVSSSGAVTASNLTLTGGSISLGSSGGNPVFYVSPSGAVSASNLTITGGSISIGNNFYVSPQGDLTANNGTFGGNVYAKNIQYGGDYGTFSGAGLTAGSIGYNSSGALGSSWYNGAVGGNNFSTMDVQGSYWADYVKANKQVICSGAVSGHHWSGAIQDQNGTQYATSWTSKTVVTSSGGASWYCNSVVGISVGDGNVVYCPINGYCGVSSGSDSTSTIYYLSH